MPAQKKNIIADRQLNWVVKIYKQKQRKARLQNKIADKQLRLAIVCYMEGYNMDLVANYLSSSSYHQLLRDKVTPDIKSLCEELIKLDPNAMQFNYVVIKS